MIAIRSVKFRLTLWYAFILAVILSIVAFFMYAEFSRVLHRDVDRSLKVEASSIRDSMESYLQGVFRGVQIAEERRLPTFSVFVTPEVKIRLIELIRDWEKSSGLMSQSTNLVRFVTVDHTELLSNLKGWETEIIFPDFERDNVFMEAGESYQTIYFQKKPIRIYYRLVSYKNRPLFIIQNAQPIDDVIQSLRRLAFIILISIPGAVLAACIAGWFLARRSFRPIDLMIKEARQITAAYLKSRLPRSEAGDELDRLADTLNEMMDRIESSTKSIQDFSSDISHELKTPLAIMRGEIDLALRRSRSSEDLRGTLKVIAEEVDGLIRLVDDLMLLVRSDSKQIQFEMKPVSLHEVLSYVFSRFQDRAISKGIDIQLELTHDAEILGDSVYLKRLFSNLLDNAIKFTPKDEKVRVELRVAEKEAVIDVSDTGIGIDPAMQTKVFARFYRTEQARAEEGSGLGLNIAKAIAEAHQGVIRISPSVPKGTLVSVALPLLKR